VCAAAAAAAAVLHALQLLPNRMVSPGVRNLVPLLLWILGTIIWGVQAAQLQHHVSAGAGLNNPAVVHWRDTTLVSRRIDVYATGSVPAGSGMVGSSVILAAGGAAAASCQCWRGGAQPSFCALRDTTLVS
jgi:hypothetical protein